MTDKKDRVHITKLVVKYFEGLEKFSMEPDPNINVIEGDNGQGKTSVLEAIRAAITNRPHRSRLVHDDEGRGVILFELSNGWQGERTVTDSGYTAGSVSLRDRRGDDVRASQTTLSNLVEGFGFNPVKFLSLKPSKQAEMLLSVVPVEISKEELIRLSGGELRREVNYGNHPLVVLSEIRSDLYSRRRDINRRAKDARSTAKELSKDIPPTFDADAFETVNLQSLMDDLDDARRHNDRRERAEERVRDLRRELAEAEEQLAEMDDYVDTEPLKKTISSYQENREIADRIKTMEEKRAEAVELEARSEAFTNLIEENRQKPAELLSRVELPIDGLGISDDGDVVINGLPIDQLSSGERLDLSVRIALETLGDFRVILVDGMETLSRSNQERLIQILYENDVQAFIARVADGALTVVTGHTPDNAGAVVTELNGSDEVFGPEDDHGLTEEEPDDADSWESILDDDPDTVAPF